MTPTILIVPGLRDEVPEHWQTILASRLSNAVAVPAMGKEDLDCAQRIDVLESVARLATRPLIVVAHSAGVITAVRWARQTRCHVVGALLAVPPDLEHPMPKGYPTIKALRDGGWLPVPRDPLPFPSIVAGSRNDPLAALHRVRQMAQDWGGRFLDLGNVGHLNPAYGFGAWTNAEVLIADLIAAHLFTEQH